MRFEKVSFESFRKDMLKYGWREECIQTAYDNIKIPERKTKYSAGYDISACIKFWIKPKESIIVPTGIKAVFSPEEKKSFHLSMHVRSSIGIHKGIVLSNGTAIIDSDYADNEMNEGDILMSLYNRGEEMVVFDAGDRIMQAIFEIHGLTVDDHADEIRRGGVGSTNEEQR